VTFDKPHARSRITPSHGAVPGGRSGATGTIAEGEHRPYRGSWADALTDRVRRLPGPSIAYYALFSALLFAIVTAIEWLVGSLEPGRFVPVQAAVCAVAGLWLRLIEQFNESARAAVRALGPARLGDPARFPEIERRLTTLPALPLVAFSVLAAAVSETRAFVSPAFLQAISDPGVGRTPSTVVLATLVAVATFIGSAWASKIVVMSWRIHRLLTHEVRVSLFDVSALFAFSRITAAMAVSMILSLVLVSVPAPTILAADVLGIAGGLFTLAIAGLCFVLPLVGVHGRLVEDKDRLTGLAVEKLRTAATDLHQALDAGDLPKFDPYQKALTGIETELRLLRDTPTWPWQRETVRWVIGALMFPVILYVLQQGIARLIP
jgi:hypothetical protein